ncbi:hypothetical protein ColLi_02379 [Colletotrichum liriopes]|uniref:Uncharacterized protein n=1 Tax=Colletotrichum liriopes TaxID=708192 RepID=A0AA37LP91_9PEZI|nr:hypothetical protein ColLi_02379 [Colletotrichum liriopes]
MFLEIRGIGRTVRRAGFNNLDGMSESKLFGAATEIENAVLLGVTQAVIHNPNVTCIKAIACAQ